MNFADTDRKSSDIKKKEEGDVAVVSTCIPQKLSVTDSPTTSHTVLILSMTYTPGGVKKHHVDRKTSG